jgi:hypothetical protein
LGRGVGRAAAFCCAIETEFNVPRSANPNKHLKTM